MKSVLKKWSEVFCATQDVKLFFLTRQWLDSMSKSFCVSLCQGFFYIFLRHLSNFSLPTFFFKRLSCLIKYYLLTQNDQWDSLIFSANIFEFRCKKWEKMFKIKLWKTLKLEWDLCFVKRIKPSIKLIISLIYCSSNSTLKNTLAFCYHRINLKFPTMNSISAKNLFAITVESEGISWIFLSQFSCLENFLHSTYGINLILMPWCLTKTSCRIMELF